MEREFNNIWRYLKSCRTKLTKLYENQTLKLLHLQGENDLTNPQMARMEAYCLQLQDISSFIDDIDEIMSFANPNLDVALVQDILEYNDFISQADYYEESYEGKFALITYRDCFLVWLDDPNSLRRLKNKYLP